MWWREFKSRLTCNYLMWVAISLAIVLLGSVFMGYQGYVSEHVARLIAYSALGMLALTGAIFAYGIITNPLVDAEMASQDES